MRLLPFLLLLLPLQLLSVRVLFAQQPSAPAETADAIMARVAANHDRAEAERGRFVYVQHATVTSHKGKQVMCEERTDSRITPTAEGSTQQLLKVDGKLFVKHRFVPYDHLPDSKDQKGSTVESDRKGLNVTVDDDDTMDRDLVENMRQNLVNNKSRDGISDKLFPLSAKALPEYRFHLIGVETMNRRTVFHITFVPVDKDDFGWKGDAYIDTTAYEPVLVRTAMAKKVPFAVRTLMGTNVPGLGFTIIYAPEPNDKPGSVWFPVSFGTEFKLHVLFFLSRTITINAENRAFEKTHVTSKILPAGDAAP
jgi:hypothetical protein